jgi:hypothetical protein
MADLEGAGLRWDLTRASRRPSFPASNADARGQPEGESVIRNFSNHAANEAKEIDDAAQHVGPGMKLDVALSVLIFLLGCALLAYLVYTVIGSR